MPLREHFREFRRRIVLSAAGILLAAIAGWFLFDPVFEGLTEPLLQAAENHDRLININFPSVASAFDMRIKVSFFIGLILSSPWWLYQVWAFITPGLTRKERRYSVAFISAAAPMFLLGVALAWFVLPRAVVLMVGFSPEYATNIMDAPGYLTFIMSVMIAFGIAFLLPVFVVVLSLAGLVSPDRWMKGWRWAVLLSFAFAAIVTPDPGMVSMIVLATAVGILYFSAIGLSRLLLVRRNRRTEVGAN